MGDFGLVGGTTLKTATGTTNSNLVVLTGGGSAHTKGVWQEVEDSLDHPANGITLMFYNGTANADALVDIAIGAISSEFVIISNFLVSAPSASLDYAFVPVIIPAGTRVVARCQSTTASGTVGIGIIFHSNGPTMPSVINGVVDTYGAAIADSGGTNVDPGATINTKGAWIELPVSASPSLVGSTFQDGGNASSVTLTTPTGRNVGDLLVAIVVNGALNDWTTPTGWTLIRQQKRDGVNDATIAAYWRVVDGTESSTYVVTQAATAACGGSMHLIRDAHTTSPINIDGGTQASQIDPITGAVTTTVRDVLIVIAVAQRNSANQTFTPPANYTEHVDDNITGALGAHNADYTVAAKTQAATGTTGSATFDSTATLAADVAGVTMAIAPRTVTRRHHHGLLLVLGNQLNAIRGNFNWLFDIGIGAGGSEVVVVPDLNVAQNSNGDVIKEGVLGPFWVDIPGGTRLAVRSQCSGSDATDRLVDVVLYGVS